MYTQLLLEATFKDLMGLIINVDMVNCNLIGVYLIYQNIIILTGSGAIWEIEMSESIYSVGLNDLKESR